MKGRGVTAAAFLIHGDDPVVEPAWIRRYTVEYAMTRVTTGTPP